MSPAVTSAKPGESTSATDPNTFFSSPSNSIQISYTAADGQLTTEELPSFPQFSADVEDVVAYPMASSSVIQDRDRTAQVATSLIGSGNYTRYEHLNQNNGKEIYCNQEGRHIDVSMKLVTIMSDPDKANSMQFVQEIQTNSNSIPKAIPAKSLELSDEEDEEHQEPGIFIDQTIFEESISSDLEVNYSDSANSDLEGELQETLSSSDTEEDIRTDSATSELEKELIPITQKLERAHHGPEPPTYEFNSTYFERSSVPEAEVIAACMSTQDYDNPPPTPGASSDYNDDFNSPPPTPNYDPSPVSAEDNDSCKSPNYERPPTPTPTLPPTPEPTPVTFPEAKSVAEPDPKTVLVQEPISASTPESTPEPASQPTPAPKPISELLPISLSTQPILISTPKTISVPAEDDSPPVLTSIYEDVQPERNSEITKPNIEGAWLVPNNSNSESPPPVLVRETPIPSSFQAITASDLLKKRRGTRKFITPKGQIMIPHSSAEIQERVKNRQRNSVSSYCSSVSSEYSTSKSEPSSPMDAQIYTEHRYFKSNGTQAEEKCTKVKSKRGRKRKGSEEQRPAKKVKPTEGLYIVEKILRKTIVAGVPYFLVKWLNYTDAKNTWEPAENFSVELITAFENSLLDTSSKPKVEPPAKRVLIPPLIRRSNSGAKKKCTGCASYPTTFTDQRLGETGFDRGFTYSKTRESFVLDGVKCGLVEFDEKRVLELIPFSIINEKVRAQLVT